MQFEIEITGRLREGVTSATLRFTDIGQLGPERVQVVVVDYNEKQEPVKVEPLGYVSREDIRRLAKGL